MIYKDILATVGNTPVIKIQNLAPEGIDIYVKAEYFNPASSVKDRLALNIINVAEKEQTLVAGQTVVEATSGNTGIGLVHLCNALGLQCRIFMPNTQSQEKVIFFLP